MAFEAVIVTNDKDGYINRQLLDFLEHSAREAGADPVSYAKAKPKRGSGLILKGEMPLLRVDTIKALGEGIMGGGNQEQDPEEFFVVDSPVKAAQALGLMRARINAGHMENGVIIPDPSTVFISHKAHIETQSIIHPNTTISGETSIGKDCVIGPNTIITDSKIMDGATVLMSVVNEAEVGAGSAVGPFAYLRPKTVLGENVKVGDFVEVKNSNIGEGTKISHLTYVGDSDVGKNINFGCGTVTVNYDGKAKYRTVIKDGAFIGCNTNLVAPVTVGENAYIAAGSTITNEVPADALAVARERQKNIEGWVAKYKMKREKRGKA
jgi:bifunctional UDP-N-acetylglucosamine pyrophosphorylase/glucosamine-1-phosphate N-acetyltransferase